MNIPNLNEIFPLSDQEGEDTQGINSRRMWSLASGSSPMKQAAFDLLLGKHRTFLLTGGAGGKWKTLLVKDIVVGIYEGREEAEGEQAQLERMNLQGIMLERVELPFANFCGCFAAGISLQETDLSYSLATDADFSNADFRSARLRQVDFSRSLMCGANFQNANLTGADFENCDLTNADFRGAKLTLSRFPGAILDGVKY